MSNMDILEMFLLVVSMAIATPIAALIFNGICKLIIKATEKNEDITK